MTKRHLTRRHMLAATGAAAATALAGCGGGGGSGPADDEGAPSADATVTIGGEGAHFDPETVEIAVGETIAWESTSADHKIRPREMPEGASWGGQQNEFMEEGDTYTHTFETAGTYTYTCSVYHGSASGTVEVTE